MSDAKKNITWDDTKEWIGVSLGKNASVDEVNKTWIRWWLECIEFDCPLHYDDETAKQYGYDGVIAPAPMAISAALPPYWNFGDPLTTIEDPPKKAPFEGSRLPSPGTRDFATDYEFEFFKPLEPGDVVYSEAKVIKILPKKLRVGDGAFITMQKEYRNQKDELLAIGINTIFKFDPAEEA